MMMSSLCLDDLLLNNHFYRQLEAKLNLSFVRQLVQDVYAPRKGRPSIDPIMYFKLQLIMFFEAIRSERQIVEQVKVNLAQRWDLGYDLGEDIPHHSSLSRIRDRYGLDTFHRFFEEVVERRSMAGVVHGNDLSTVKKLGEACTSPSFLSQPNSNLSYLSSTDNRTVRAQQRESVTRPYQ